jgi:ribokinase
MPSDILVVGSINMDVSVYVPHIPSVGETVLGRKLVLTPGGKGANQAVAAAKLGGRTAIVGKVGKDWLGSQLRENLASAAVDVTMVDVEQSGIPTGMALISVDPSGNNAIAVAPGANQCLSPEDVEKADTFFRAGGFLLIQLEIPMETVRYTLSKAKGRGMTTILDPAPAVLLPPKLLECVDILTPNETEAQILLQKAPGPMSIAEAERIAIALQGGGARSVILKLGDKGAWLQGPSNVRRHFPAYEVQAVDTTAAGDVFNGALAAALARAEPKDIAISFASAAAALSTTRIGAQVSVPDRKEVEQFLTQELRPRHQN